VAIAEAVVAVALIFLMDAIFDLRLIAANNCLVLSLWMPQRSIVVTLKIWSKIRIRRVSEIKLNSSSFLRLMSMRFNELIVLVAFLLELLLGRN